MINHPEHSSDSERNAQPIEDIRQTVPRRLAGIMGTIVDFGAEIGTEAGKLAAYASGRVVKGVQEVRNAAKHGMKGNEYPETK